MALMYRYAVMLHKAFAKAYTGLSSADRAQGFAWDALLAYGQRCNVLVQILGKLRDKNNVFGVEICKHDKPIPGEWSS